MNKIQIIVIRKYKMQMTLTMLKNNYQNNNNKRLTILRNKKINSKFMQMKIIISCNIIKISRKIIPQSNKIRIKSTEMLSKLTILIHPQA